MIENKREIERIKKVYERRKEWVPSQRYSFFNDSNLFLVQRREWEILKVFKLHKIISLEDYKILDIGCGKGGELINFIRYGAKPANLYGIDLRDESIDEAKKISPNIEFKSGNAEILPYESDFFDIVMQFTVFTSILDINMKKNVAAEIIRVLKPGGIVLWYDYHVDNPKNSDVRGVTKKEIHKLFSDCNIHLRRITLAPPLVRAIVPYSVLACYCLEKMIIFNTHYLGIIRKSID